MAGIPMVDLQRERDFVGKSIVSNILDCVESNSFILGPRVSKLETELVNFVDDGAADGEPLQCICVSSGTDALQMVLMALNIGPGDEVVTVPYTWISPAEVISLVGAEPRFVDVVEDTFNMDPTSLARAFTSRTRAVIAVSLFGYPADMKSIRAECDVAERLYGTNIALIEDAAQSFGASRDGEKSCASSFAVAGTTSFFPAKPLGCYGDGGAVFTRSESLATAVREIRTHGRSKTSGLHERVGLNGRLDALQAAVLLAKLPRYAELLQKRQAVAQRYNALFEGCSELARPVLRAEDSDNCRHTYAVYSIRSNRKESISTALQEAGIGHAHYYPLCLHLQPVFAGSSDESNNAFPVSERLSSQTLALPVHPFLTNEDQDRIVDVVLSAARSAL